MRGQLSCEYCGSTEIRRVPVREAPPRWMCRSCVIAEEIVDHAHARMHAAQQRAKGHDYLLHGSENIKRNIAASRTRARRWNLPATLDLEDWTRTVTFFADACAYCGDKWEEIEHATPLCRGGGSTSANCLPTCDYCNKKKHQKTLEELLDGDLWPHRTERLKRALSWLQQQGRTAADPSGQLTLENGMLAELRGNEGFTSEWFAPNIHVLFSLVKQRLVSAKKIGHRRWKIELTQTGRLPC